jgi:hypothetical protein
LLSCRDLFALYLYFYDDLNVNVSYYLNAKYIAIYIIVFEVTFSVSECIFMQ